MEFEDALLKVIYYTVRTDHIASFTLTNYIYEKSGVETPCTYHIASFTLNNYIRI